MPACERETGMTTFKLVAEIHHRMVITMVLGWK